MAKIDLDSPDIEELARPARTRHRQAVRESRYTRAELEAELEKLAQYGKPPVKKAESAPAPKAKKSEESKEPKERLQRPPDEAARQGARYKAV